MQISKAIGATIALSMMLGLAPAARAADADHKDEWSKINILFVPWSQSSNPFFEAVISGAKDAAAQQGVNLDVQFGEEDQQHQLGILETGIANKVTGIAVNISDDNAYIDVLCNAMKQNIPVVTFNIDDSRHGAAGSTCRLAFMGQNFADAGYVLGKRMIEEHHLKKGDVVFTPVEAPQATYAVQRHAGVQKALEEIGATSEILGTGNDHAQALNLMTQYLLGHPNTAAVVGLGQTPTSQAVQAIKDAGLKIPAAGFDVSKEILDNIANGELTAAVDQQPYSQGYYAVTELALYLKYGLYPSEMDTGGKGLIDKTNYKLAEKWAGPVR
ncbi:substrate-binding domain-containing protein [Mesorhizobium sp. BH1-1-4]|uniref:substrate-binding domain-containing protein n=1 Tax=Mesorhizobium sp. BH1-1-4 TaxID=2876662 RepID=UPI001CD18180|nr:substrate-binding domain-containing protein [Mesorhizobium sp. BH1-1-4]MBZ9994232.1 substrate-binding domain-containing protein [Mesorhizobium sp. BH1-1-4]